MDIENVYIFELNIRNLLKLCMHLNDCIAVRIILLWKMYVAVQVVLQLPDIFSMYLPPEGRPFIGHRMQLVGSVHGSCRVRP